MKKCLTISGFVTHELLKVEVGKMATYIVLKNSIGGELSEDEVLPGESIDNALIRLLQSKQLGPLDEGDTIEIVIR